MKSITLDELIAIQTGSADANLIDVRLEEDFAAGHIPGAKNVTVFNVSFLSDIDALGHSKSDTLIVYGAGADSHESRMASDKLTRGGSTDVREFRGGLEAWLAANNPVEGGEAFAANEPLNGTFSLDLAESRVEWIGRNLLNKHFGTIAIKSGHVNCRKGVLEDGDFVVDMNSMKCADIPDSKMRGILIDHLKSDDFFEVGRYPEARFKIRQIEGVEGATRGTPDVRVTGELTLRGQVSPLVLMAVTGLNEDGRFSAQAVLTFDRTLWGSIYGSGKFFKNVGMHLVNDLIEIQVRLVA